MAKQLQKYPKNPSCARSNFSEGCDTQRCEAPEEHCGWRAGEMVAVSSVMCTNTGDIRGTLHCHGGCVPHLPPRKGWSHCSFNASRFCFLLSPTNHGSLSHQTPTLSLRPIYANLLYQHLHRNTWEAPPPFLAPCWRGIVVAGVLPPYEHSLARSDSNGLFSFPDCGLKGSRVRAVSGGPLRGSYVFNVPWGTGSGLVNNGLIIWLIIDGTLHATDKGEMWLQKNHSNNSWSWTFTTAYRVRLLCKDMWMGVRRLCSWTNSDREDRSLHTLKRDSVHDG